MVRVTTSPAAGCGTASSRIAKSSRLGGPSGRRFSTTERQIDAFWLIAGSMIVTAMRDIAPCGRARRFRYGACRSSPDTQRVLHCRGAPDRSSHDASVQCYSLRHHNRPPVRCHSADCDRRRDQHAHEPHADVDRTGIVDRQAASERSTRRPVTLPSRSRISASLAWLCGTVATGSAGRVPSCASFTSSRSSFGLPT